MGNSKQALSIIIDKLGDIEEVLLSSSMEVVFALNYLPDLGYKEIILVWYRL